ncbi:MAG TPA: PAS domain S-box protein [Nitrospira sp.]|nr:PAS domain S-box protein [Nitrospira sp.]
MTNPIAEDSSVRARFDSRNQPEGTSTTDVRERHFQSLYDNNPSMYFTLSADGTVLSVNRYGAEQLGHEPDDLIGQSVLAVFKTDDHKAVLAQLAVCTASPGKLFEWEIQKIRKDGTPLWVKERAQAIQDSLGRELILVVCEDITARRLTEEIVRENEERWRALFEHAGVGIAQLSLTGQFLRVNPRLCETLGYSTKTLLQRTFQELTHPEDLEANVRFLKELTAATRPSFSMEKRYRRSDDTWVWVNTTVSLVRTATQVPSYYIAVVEDISERKRSEEALRDNEQAIRSLHESISTPGLTFDQRVQTVLELGRRRFRLPIGVLTSVHDDHLELTHVCADDEKLQAGMRLPLAQSFCGNALKAGEVLSFGETGLSDCGSHPEYTALGLKCYIGTKLPGLQRVHGTMCFAGRESYPGRFSAADKDFLLLMARWIGGELDRRDSELALKDQESLLRSVIDTATDAIFMKDQNGRYRFINQAGASVMGLLPEQVVGKTDRELFPPETASRLMGDDLQVLNGTEQRQFEHLIARAGQGRIFYSIKTPHRDRGGHIVGLVGVSRDMTEVKRAEDALRLTQIAVDRAADLAFWIGPDAKFLYVNDAACERLGYARAELLSMTVADIDADYQLEHWPVHWDQLRRKGRLRFESRHRTKSGEMYPVEIVANYVTVDEHEYNFAFARDISDRKRATEERERLSQDLHDNILQSLYAVGMQLEANKLALGKSARKSKTYASQAIDQLNRLVGDVRHFIALLKQGDAHRWDFREALHQLVSAFSAAGHRPPDLAIEEDVLPLLNAEQADQLLNIAREALSNSVRHAQATDRSITLHRKGRIIRMRICDNGIGFVSKLKRKQGHGLSNMAARARNIGARLRLVSRPNRGTCVTVDLTVEHTV